MCCCAGANYYFITHLLCLFELQINNRTAFVTRAHGPCAASHTRGLAPVFFSLLLPLENVHLSFSWREYPACSATWVMVQEGLLPDPKAKSLQVNNQVPSSRPVNCLHARPWLSETDVAGSSHVMN